MYLQYQEATLKFERMKTENIRWSFGTNMLDCINEISILKLNTTKQVTKMMGDIEEVRYSMMKSLKKENKLVSGKIFMIKCSINVP